MSARGIGNERVVGPLVTRVGATTGAGAAA
jgi:hypothetical protein